MLKPNSIITRQFAEELLKQHGIDGIFDDDTGSSFASKYGVHDTYRLRDVKIWLGF